MTPTPMTRLAEARPEVARRPHTVVPPDERAALLRAIIGASPTGASDVAPDVDVVELDLRARPSRSRRPRLLAAAVLLVVAAIGLGLVLRDDDGSTPVAPAAPAPTAPRPEVPGLPAGFDVMTASPVFAAGGDVNAVLDAYVADRWDRGLLPTVRVTEDRDDQATAAWSLGPDDDGEGVPSGSILLRRDPGGWSVVASTIEGIELSSMHHTGTRVTGTVERVGEDNALFVDLLDSSGREVADTIEDDGAPRSPSIPVDVAVDTPVVLRTTLLGGGVLGVGEVALDPPPVVVGDDTDIGAVRVERRLGVTCVGLASGEGRVCTTAADQLWPPDVWYLQLGPTARRGDRVLITGLVNPAVATVQVRTADGVELDGATSRTAVDDGAFVVVAVPLVDGPVSVELQNASGRVVETVGLAGLLPVGG